VIGLRRTWRTQVVPQERRSRVLILAAGASVVVGLVPVVPRPGTAGAASAAPAPAVFAAAAEAWAYSAEIGVPGPLGPLASHTTAAIDNSPHAQGTAGLADPGYLVRAAAGLVAGIPTPAYCESAWPEGPDHADCGAPGGAKAAVSGTRSGDGPRATATAALADAAVPTGSRATPRHGVAAEPAALTVAAQSTTSSAFLADDGVLHATADVVLSGVALAGGALRIGTLAVHRTATATGLPGGTKTSAAVELSGVSVGGQPVDLGSDPARSLAQAAQQALGDTIAVEGLSGREEQADEGKLVADSSGLRITWQPQPDRFLRIVLGYGRVLVYATGPPSGEPVPGGDISVPGPRPESPVAAGAPDGTGPTGAAPLPPDSAAASGSAAAASLSPTSRPSVAGGSDANAIGSAAGESLPVAGPAAAPPAELAAGGAAPVPLLPGLRPLAVGTRPPVQWVSPFMVLAQMTTGRQAWWFLLGLAPLLAAGWLARRGGLGLVAPWAADGRSGAPS
jgi:hypothetical protein